MNDPVVFWVGSLVMAYCIFVSLRTYARTRLKFQLFAVQPCSRFSPWLPARMAPLPRPGSRLPGQELIWSIENPESAISADLRDALSWRHQDAPSHQQFRPAATPSHFGTRLRRVPSAFTTGDTACAFLPSASAHSDCRASRPSIPSAPAWTWATATSTPPRSTATRPRFV